MFVVSKVFLHFLYNTFYLLDTDTNSISNLHLAFMVQLTTYLGFMPGGRYKDGYRFDMEAGVFFEVDSGLIHSLDERKSNKSLRACR